MEEEDLYILFQLKDIETNVTDTIIKKAYHKQALDIRPHKFRDNLIVATKIFQKLHKVYTIISDKNAQGSYDKLQQGKKEQRLNAKHKKFKRDLKKKNKIYKHEQNEKYYFMDDFMHKTFEFKNGLFVSMEMQYQQVLMDFLIYNSFLTKLTIFLDTDINSDYTYQCSGNFLNMLVILNQRQINKDFYYTNRNISINVFI